MSKRKSQQGMGVETATYVQDLPHEFAAEVDGRLAPSSVCSVCTAGAGDLRHIAWETANQADRERAQAGGSREIQREFG